MTTTTARLLTITSLALGVLAVTCDRSQAFGLQDRHSTLVQHSKLGAGNSAISNGMAESRQRASNAQQAATQALVMGVIGGVAAMSCATCRTRK